MENIGFELTEISFNGRLYHIYNVLPDGRIMLSPADDHEEFEYATKEQLLEQNNSADAVAEIQAAEIEAKS